MKIFFPIGAFYPSQVGGPCNTVYWHTCALAGNGIEVLISTHDHGYDYKSELIGKSLEIGEHAFIGSRSSIMHNCNYIGKHAVVGTSSLVTKDVPDYAVVAGNPAQVIKYIDDVGKG